MQIVEPDYVMDDHGTPHATGFDDIYFHPGSGLEETRHVFLAGNRLAERFAALEAGQVFVVGELGLGTGLNVLAACRLFEEVATVGARLSMVSVEGMPLPGAEMDRQLAAFAALDPWQRALNARGLIRAPGVHRVRIGERVDLTVYFGGVEEALGQMALGQAAVDAWFLDGFAPARNPGMWSETVLGKVGAVTKPGGTAATFTSAGFVRRNLKKAGFVPVKVPGFGGKREMTVAEKAAGEAASGIRKTVQKADKTVPDTVLVIGAGWAGAAAAEALSRRGVRVTVLESERVASGASGMPQAVLEPLETVAHTPRSAFYTSAFVYAHRWLTQRGLLHASGLVRKPSGHKDEAWLKRAAAHAGWLDGGATWSEASRGSSQSSEGLAEASGGLSQSSGGLGEASGGLSQSSEGLAEASGGLVQPSGGWVEPNLVCRALMEGIEVIEGVEVLGARHDQDGWRVATSAGVYRAKGVVFAGASALTQLAGFNAWPLQPVRGQMSCPRATEASGRLAEVVCGKGYVLPAFRGRHAVGATFGPGDTGTELRPEDHAENRQKLADLDPKLAEAMDWTDVRGRAGTRCSTPDRLPMIGPVPDEPAWRLEPPTAAGNTDWVQTQPILPHAMVSVGHGSRGLMSSLIGGELIADLLLGGALPLGADALAAVTPARFIVRRLKKQLTPAMGEMA